MGWVSFSLGNSLSLFNNLSPKGLRVGGKKRAQGLRPLFFLPSFYPGFLLIIILLSMKRDARGPEGEEEEEEEKEVEV